MDADKVKELKARADLASRIASDIEKVTAAKKFDDIDWLLRDEALRLAKTGLLARLESELLGLLCEPAVKPLTPPSECPLTLIEPVKREPWFVPAVEPIGTY